MKAKFSDAAKNIVVAVKILRLISVPRMRLPIVWFQVHEHRDLRFRSIGYRDCLLHIPRDYRRRAGDRRSSSGLKEERELVLTGQESIDKKSAARIRCWRSHIQRLIGTGSSDAEIHHSGAGNIAAFNLHLPPDRPGTVTKHDLDSGDLLARA